MADPIQLATARVAKSDCSEILREMAAQADRGEIVCVTVLYERPDGSIGNWMSGTKSQTRMAGALLDAAIRRLGYVEQD